MTLHFEDRDISSQTANPIHRTTKFTVPDELNKVMMDFSREVVKCNAYENGCNREGEIYHFGARYFQARLDTIHRQQNEEEWESESGEDDDMPSEEQIAQIIKDTFLKFDDDGNGTLEKNEFKQWFKSLKTFIPGLQDKDRAVFWKAADVDGDGHIEFEEFEPVANQLIMAALAKQKLDKEASQLVQWHGMDGEYLQDFCAHIFRHCDADGNGYLDPDEFRDALVNANECAWDEFGEGIVDPPSFTEAEIEQICILADENGDGMIEYHELLPVMCDVLLDNAHKAAVENKLDEMYVQNEDQYWAIQDFLYEAFGDSETIKFDAISDILSKLENEDGSKVLTPFQIPTVLSAAEADEHGEVQAQKFIDKATAIIGSLGDVISGLGDKKELLAKTKAFMEELAEHFKGVEMPMEMEEKFTEMVREVTRNHSFPDGTTWDEEEIEYDLISLCKSSQGYDIKEMIRIGSKVIKAHFKARKNNGGDEEYY